MILQRRDLAFSGPKSSTTGNSPGTYKSEDGGKTWTEVVDGYFIDLAVVSGQTGYGLSKSCLSRL